MEAITLKFICNNEESVNIKVKKKDKIEEVLKKYKEKTGKQNKILDFFYNDNKINEDFKLGNINSNEIIIKVKENKIISILKSSLPAAVPIAREVKYSKIIICPLCKKSCIISFKNYNILLDKCESSSHNTIKLYHIQYFYFNY